MDVAAHLKTNKQTNKQKIHVLLTEPDTGLF